jgi:acetylornithine deacetylase/succinyl-diaminopimelate desuccinylase-like protein
MKGHVAAAAVAVASLAREGFEPAGDLIFAATADEEMGEGEALGAEWLCAAHPEALRAEFAINEGGGDRVAVGGRVLHLCATAEKASSPFALHVRGRSGHASMPAIADNALVRAAPLLERLASFADEPTIGPEVAGFLRAALDEVPAPAEALDRARGLGSPALELVEPLLGLTVSPTMIHASDKRNVVPGSCEVTVDCRLLPGQTQADAERAIRAALGDGQYELAWLSYQGGTRSPLETPLWSAVESFVSEVEPGARLAPICVAGFTDSHWLREAYGTVAYGFFPIRAMSPEEVAGLIHSANERIAVDDLECGVQFLRHVAQAIGG